MFLVFTEGEHAWSHANPSPQHDVLVVDGAKQTCACGGKTAGDGLACPLPTNSQTFCSKSCISCSYSVQGELHGMIPE